MNRKVINATKVIVDGEKRDSKLESHMRGMLLMIKIPHEYQKEYVIQEGFEYNGKNIRPIKIKVDFFFKEHNLIVDTKGHQTESNKIKIKMLKHYFFDNDMNPIIELPRIKKQCDSVIRKILDKNYLKSF